MSDEYTLLTIKIEYEDSISLSDFKKSLEGWNNQYVRYVSKTASEDGNDELLIKEIKQGSIIIGLASSIIPLISDYSTVINFFASLKQTFSWLQSKIGTKPKMEINDLENVKKILAPINQNGRNIHISVTGNNNYTPIIIDSGVSKTIAFNADEEIKKPSAPEKENERVENK